MPREEPPRQRRNEILVEDKWTVYRSPHCTLLLPMEPTTRNLVKTPPVLLGIVSHIWLWYRKMFSGRVQKSRIHAPIRFIDLVSDPNLGIIIPRSIILISKLTTPWMAVARVNWPSERQFPDNPH